MTKGFTILELLIIIAMIAVLGAATVPFLSGFYLKTNLDTTKKMLVSSVRKAQNYAMDGKNGAVWGVCMSGTSLRVFQGSCATPTVAEDYTVPANISLTGLTTTTFSSGRGEPSATFSATLSSGAESHTVLINAAGALTIN